MPLFHQIAGVFGIDLRKLSFKSVLKIHAPARLISHHLVQTIADPDEGCFSRALGTAVNRTDFRFLLDDVPSVGKERHESICRGEKRADLLRDGYVTVGNRGQRTTIARIIRAVPLNYNICHASKSITKFLDVNRFQPAKVSLGPKP